MIALLTVHKSFIYLWGGGDRGEGYERWEKKDREVGSLRCREAGEKFRKASFCYLLLLIIQSKKRTQQRFLTSIFSTLRGLKQKFID